MSKIALTRGKVALVDDEDYERVMAAGPWGVLMTGTGLYAKHGAGSKRYPCLLMHRFVVSAPAGGCVDHINHDGLDNRKVNLRICSSSQNSGNQNVRRGKTSALKGVCWDSGKKHWLAQLGRGEGAFLGRYDSEEGAARAYDDAARRVYGPFAYLNYPNPGEQGGELVSRETQQRSIR